MDTTLAVGLKDRFATNLLGEYAVAKVIERAIERGVRVSRPVIECRYDLIVDDGLKLYRTQVKYAGGACPRQCQGAVVVGLSKWRNDGRAEIPYYTAAEIDLLLVYVRKMDRILWFGPEVFDGRKKLHIRVEPTRNNQKKGCLMAIDYLW
jgi:hypothetical protein